MNYDNTEKIILRLNELYSNSLNIKDELCYRCSGNTLTTKLCQKHIDFSNASRGLRRTLSIFIYKTCDDKYDPYTEGEENYEMREELETLMDEILTYDVLEFKSILIKINNKLGVIIGQQNHQFNK